ncbi:MAG: OadG family protein [Anaerovoracaceae bacterium]
MNDMSIMDKFADPSLIDTLTMGEKAAGAGITTLMGMGITFLILILIWAVIALMSRIIAKADAGRKADAEPAAAAVGNGGNRAEEDSPADFIDMDGEDITEEELTAVIMAAIEAYRADTGVPGSRLVVRKIMRTNSSCTPWGAAGIADCMENRKVN